MTAAYATQFWQRRTNILARSNKSRTRAKATKKHQIRQPGLIRQTCHVLAATNKSLAQINKCWNMGKATKTIASAT